MKEVKELFEKLDSWRNLPSFRLEPCVAPYIGYFLPTILSEAMNVKVIEPIIPEFPLYKDNEKKHRHSNKVDYFALSEDRSTAYLVELKTDIQSVNDKQINFLEKARKHSLCYHINKVFFLSEGTSQKTKYKHLKSELCKLNVIEGDKPNCEKTAKIRVIYIVPKNQIFRDKVEKREIDSREISCDDIISFEDIASILEVHSELGQILSCYLSTWQESPGK